MLRKCYHSSSSIKVKLSNSFYLFIYLFIYFTVLAVLGLLCCAGLSLVVASRGLSLVVMHKLFIVVASPITYTLEFHIHPRVWTLECPGFSNSVHRHGCSMARGVFQDKDQSHVSCTGRWTLSLSHWGSPIQFLSPTFHQGRKCWWHVDELQFSLY